MVFKKLTPLFNNLICLSLVAIVLFSASFPAFALTTNVKNYFFENTTMYDFSDTFPTPFFYNDKAAPYDSFVVFYSSIDNRYYGYYYYKDFCSVDFADYVHEVYGQVTTILIKASASEYNRFRTHFNMSEAHASQFFLTFLRSGLFIWTGDGWVRPFEDDRENYRDYARLEQVADGENSGYVYALTYNPQLSPTLPYLTAYPIAFNTRVDISNIAFETSPTAPDVINYRVISNHILLGQLLVDGTFQGAGSWYDSSLSQNNGVVSLEIPNALISQFKDLPDWSVDLDLSNKDILDELLNFLNYNPVTQGFIFLGNIIGLIISTLNLQTLIFFIVGLSFIAIIYGRR